MMFPPLCLTMGISCPPTTVGQDDAKEIVLVSFHHSTFSQAFMESFRYSLANLKQACTCAFLSRGTLQKQGVL